MIYHEVRKGGRDYVGYEYKAITADNDRVSMYLDCYECFGWKADDSQNPQRLGGSVTLKLKRDRKILNKAELTRLQQHFEACMDDIRALEESRARFATMIALIVGIVGTAFIAGSVFAVTHSPPMILLCVILAIPGFMGWALPMVLFRALVRKRAEVVNPIIEEKYDEIHEICEKGNSLL